MIKCILLVTGARKNVEKKFVYSILDRYLLNYFSNEIILIHGNALGVDSFAQSWSNDHGIYEISVPAKWNSYGKKAGSIRNELMVQIALTFKKAYEQIDVFIEAFPSIESVGTYDCINRANKYNLIVNVNKFDEN